MPKVEWTKDALDDLQRLDKPVGRRILNKITWLSQHFNNITPEPLSGELSGAFKLRVGDWRVIYTVEKEVIVIQAIGHRREIYKT
ncbi:MAG: type II toxin-antitoxin system RelE/ParE family toxin [Deltaproteobacteria bacterium]|nr:type II toxin-antitoxin system RelE/ParE family toxin [Deltaproteobacteria bacterium]